MFSTVILKQGVWLGWLVTPYFWNSNVLKCISRPRQVTSHAANQRTFWSLGHSATPRRLVLPSSAWRRWLCHNVSRCQPQAADTSQWANPGRVANSCSLSPRHHGGRINDVSGRVDSYFAKPQSAVNRSTCNISIQLFTGAPKRLTIDFRWQLYEIVNTVSGRRPLQLDQTKASALMGDLEIMLIAVLRFSQWLSTNKMCGGCGRW
jgi:hypothetical protein